MNRFVAVRLARPVTEAIEGAVGRLAPWAADLRWTYPSGWHITVAFLGALTDAERDVAETVVQDVAGRVGPFPLTTASAGRFGDRVLWVGVEDVDGGLTRLTDRVRTALAARGIEVVGGHRPLRPHITVARSRGRRRTVLRSDAAQLEVAPTSWDVRSLELWSNPGDGRYVVDLAAELTGPGTEP